MGIRETLDALAGDGLAERRRAVAVGIARALCTHPTLGVAVARLAVPRAVRIRSARERAPAGDEITRLRALAVRGRQALHAALRRQVAVRPRGSALAAVDTVREVGGRARVVAGQPRVPVSGAEGRVAGFRQQIQHLTATTRRGRREAGQDDEPRDHSGRSRPSIPAHRVPSSAAAGSPTIVTRCMARTGYGYGGKRVRVR
jgi:hypothetical protein